LVVLLVLTYRRFQFSNVSYGLIAFFMTLHAVGAHHTYAEVPLGFWLKDLFSLSRNPFDRLVHFAFGALLVYPVREWLMRLAGVREVWSYYLPVSAVLASPELGNAYLETQGDEWDAQKDMASAFGGAALAMIVTLTISKGVRKTALTVE
jgi:putative membrane protein